MIRNNRLLIPLVVLLFLSCLGTVLLATRHFFAVVELQRLQAESALVNNALTSAQALANEAIQYSRRNPAITSVLEQFKAKAPLRQSETSIPEGAPLAPTTMGP